VAEQDDDPTVRVPRAGAASAPAAPPGLTAPPRRGIGRWVAGAVAIAVVLGVAGIGVLLLQDPGGPTPWTPPPAPPAPLALPRSESPPAPRPEPGAPPALPPGGAPAAPPPPDPPAAFAPSATAPASPPLASAPASPPVAPAPAVPPATPAPPPVAALPVPAPPPAAPLPFVPLLTEAEISEHRAALPTMLRLAANPRVFVLDFPSLESQGAALNRVAALVEKAGQPRDRVLRDAELAAAIAAAGDTPATYYFGHDYRGSALDRFFALAERDGVVLSPAERWVAQQLAVARRLVPEGEIALVSAAAPGRLMDAAMRAAVLRHEIAHGHYFTIPAYAAHVRRVWTQQFTAAEREAFRRYLASEGYDRDDEDLMANEAQAYLLFTPDPRVFAPRHIGTDAAGLDSLRARMAGGAPLP
jgi:hypothetical protein